jgi:predicted GNAT family N-acyltransferase
MSNIVSADNQLSWASTGGKTLRVRQLRVDEIDSIYALNRKDLTSEIAPPATAKRMLEHNSDALWGVYEIEAGQERLAGFMSFLMVNNEGVELLRRNRFNASDPDTRYLAPSGERPAVGYIWLTVAPGLGSIAIPLVTHAMGPLYKGLPLCSVAASLSGLRTLLNFGFHPLDGGPPQVGKLFWRDGLEALSGAKTNAAPTLRAVVAHTADEFDQARAIRAAVFMAEQDCPYSEEFDGNDYTATHLVGYVGTEPAATLRLRYFGDFVKIERLAVLKRFRSQGIADEIIRYALDFLSRKGFRKGYGHPQVHLLPLWGKYGFKRIESVPEFVFSDRQYAAVAGDLPGCTDGLCISVDGDPYVTVRPEGEWDAPGVLDRSAMRGAINPVGR